MPRRNKGLAFAPGLMGFSLIVAAALFLLFFLSYVPVVKDVLAIKAEAQLYVFNNDEGSALASLLASTNNGVTYEEIMGSVIATGSPDDMDQAIIDTIEKLEGGISVEANNQRVKTYGDLHSRTVRADIALPGIRSGEVIAS